jgi:hypothetical protein
VRTAIWALFPPHFPLIKLSHVRVFLCRRAMGSSKYVMLVSFSDFFPLEQFVVTGRQPVDPFFVGRLPSFSFLLFTSDFRWNRSWWIVGNFEPPCVFSPPRSERRSKRCGRLPTIELSPIPISLPVASPHPGVSLSPQSPPLPSTCST